MKDVSFVQPIPGAEGQPIQPPQIQATRKFPIYGSRSLSYGSELLSALLCQVWDNKQARYEDKTAMRLIYNFKGQYLRVFENALGRSTTINY